MLTGLLPKDIKIKTLVAGNYQKGKPDKQLGKTLSLRPWEGVLGSVNGDEAQ